MMLLGELFVEAPVGTTERVILVLIELPYEAQQNASVTLPDITWLLVEQARLGETCWRNSRGYSTCCWCSAA
jgi:hypothetical protein